MLIKKRCLAGIAGALLICLLAINTASAYNADIACTSLREVIAASDDLTALELIAEYSDDSVSTTKLWTENVIGPEETLCANLKFNLGNEDKERDLSRILLTTVAEEKRVSYELSSKTSMFVKLPEAVEFPMETIQESLGDAEKGLRYNYEIVNSYSHSLNGYSLTFVSDSYTEPDTVLPVMKAESWVKKWNGITWVDSCYSGDTKWYTTYAHAPGGPVTLQSGTYKQFANFEGLHVDRVPYAEYHDEASSFSVP